MQGTVEELVAKLQLIPHPEAGYFRETFRSGATPMQSRGLTDPTGSLTATEREGNDRNELTSILYLVTRAQPFHYMCANRSDIVHYWHGGGALTYLLVSPAGDVQAVTLGPDVARGQQLQVAVRGGWFKGAELEEGADFCLLGEAVAPGFDFRDLAWVTVEMLGERVSEAAVGADTWKRLRAVLNAKALSTEETLQGMWHPCRPYGGATGVHTGVQFGDDLGPAGVEKGQRGS